LVIAGQIELLGAEGGVPSTIPICYGAVFTLAPEYDMGAPQPVVDLLAGGLLDGERPIGRRSSNRTVSIPVKITAPTRDRLAAAREVLLLLTDEDTWQLTWTRDGGEPMILDCFRAAPSVPANDLFAEQMLVSYITISFAALPYGRNDIAEQIVYPVPSQIWDQPTGSVTLDAFGTTVNYLQGDAATFESGIAGWVPITNCTVARSTAQAHAGSASLLLTSAAAGAMTAAHTDAANYGTQMIGVTSGQVVNVGKWFRAQTVARSCNVGADFYDENGLFISTLRGSNITDSTSAWTQATGALTAPTGAVWARLNDQVLATGGAGEGHFTDDGSIDTGNALSLVDNGQWSSSTVTPVTGQKSAKWGRTPQDYPAYDHVLPAPLDITGRAKLTFWLGLATTAAQYRNWSKGTIHTKVTLYDSSGQSISFSGRLYCRTSGIERAPHWQRIGHHIQQVSYGFDYSTVSRYRIEVWNRWDSTIWQPGATQVGQPVLQASAYIANVLATATGTGTALTRGLFAEMPGIIGSARTALAIQAQPGPSAFSTVVEFTTVGTNAWTAPAGVTKVDKAETWGGGGGGAGRGTGGTGSAVGGGGGGGGEYAIETAVPVTAGNSYPATVGAGGTGGSAGNPGNPGGDSFWQGQTGAQVRAHGGRGGWVGVTWGGGKGGTGSTNAARNAGGNGHQSNANLDNFGGGGGGSGGTGSAGKNASTTDRQGAGAVTGGGPGGDGGNWDGARHDGQSPPTGPGGGGGGGNQGSGSVGASGVRGKVRLTYGASGILPLNSLLVHVPARSEPPTYQALCPVGGGSDVPNGTTEYIIPPPPGLTVGARYDGTYTLYAVASSWNSPSTSRTVTVQVRQYPYSGGAAATVTVARTLTPNADVVNGYVDMGAVSLPVVLLPPGNASAEFRITVQSSNTSDRFLDVALLSSGGQTLLVNVPGTSIFQNVWIDPPDTNHPLGIVSGSNADRDQAFSLAQYIERYSGGPFSVDPQITNRILVYAAQGAPGFTATYLPAWWMDRAVGR
jgi:hypothetical protein